jgi:hypothetical protein
MHFRHFSGDESFKTGPDDALTAPDAQAEADAAVMVEESRTTSVRDGQSGAKL